MSSENYCSLPPFRTEREEGRRPGLGRAGLITIPTEIRALKRGPIGETDMRLTGRTGPGRALAAAGALMLSCTLAPGAARADDTYVMKITLPTLNDAPHQYAKDYAAALQKDSGGRIKAEVYPASQLGSIPRQIEGVQFGAIQCAVIPPDFFVGVDERFEVMAAPGLVATLQQGQRVAADPEVRKLMLGLGADKGLHSVGLFIAAQSAI